MTDPFLLLLNWCDSFKRGNDFDTWGQIVEASDEYNRLFQQIKKQLVPEKGLFTDEQKKFLSKVAACLHMRSKSLQNSQTQEISLDGLRQVYPVLENLLSGKKGTFPIKIEHPYQFIDTECQQIVENDHENDEHVVQVGGTLLPRISREANCHRMSIRIVKVGVKDPSEYINPFLTVSVKGRDGVSVGPSQDTPVSKIKETNSILFSTEIELQRVVEKLPKESAIFFEFKHFKPKKKKISTKCWAFMELDELKPGPACIELYKKPTDFLRKKFSLLTVKPLYLHLFLTLHDDDDDT